MIVEILQIAAFLAGGWLVLLLLLLASFPAVQRHAFYAHKLPIWRREDLDHPGAFGFLPNQVFSFQIESIDMESWAPIQLYAWLILPLRAYSRHEKLLAEQMSYEDGGNLVLKLIKEDPHSRLVIYFHGNASTVASTRQTEAYRAISTADSEHIYVLTFDYRGFGRSSGSPTEHGLRLDASAVVTWAIDTLKIPHHRILLLGQSLGTAVITSFLEYHSAGKPSPLSPLSGAPFAGVILCAPFTCMEHAFMNSRVIKGVPLLAPLKHLPFLGNWFCRCLAEVWPTDYQLQSILHQSEHLKLTIIHCTTDEVVPYGMGETLANSAHDNLRLFGDVEATATEPSASTTIKQWKVGERVVRFITLGYGGHNTLGKWAPVALEVTRMLDHVDTTAPFADLDDEEYANIPPSCPLWSPTPRERTRRNPPPADRPLTTSSPPALAR
ncbi:Alpha/Beta hydrolase protein [Xylariomycetidae sp. FL0641]|nr:Alpha/Beta hydrolase protein [Xylariomycetidae sp. FL0641]